MQPAELLPPPPLLRRLWERRRHCCGRHTGDGVGAGQRRPIARSMLRWSRWYTAYISATPASRSSHHHLCMALCVSANRRNGCHIKCSTDASINTTSEHGT